MGLRLEWVVSVALVVIVSGVMLLKLTSTSADNTVSAKELEFTDTTLIDVDTTSIQSHSYGTYGVRENGILTVDNLVYHTDTIESLLAKKGRMEGDMLYLDGDVDLQEKEGYRYETQHASYDQKNEILTILSPFRARRGKNSMVGDTLRYDMRKKEAFGTTINSVVYTTEK
jgi:lipopolysaccharide export system protein LptA